MIMLIFLVMKLTEKTLFPCYNYWREETTLFRSTSCHQEQARDTSKTIQNDVIHLYASKIKERLTAELGAKDLSFMITADEGTDPHSNQEILSLCLRFVDQSYHTILMSKNMSLISCTWNKQMPP